MKKDFQEEIKNIRPEIQKQFIYVVASFIPYMFAQMIFHFFGKIIGGVAYFICVFLTYKAISGLNKFKCPNCQKLLFKYNKFLSQGWIDSHCTKCGVRLK